MKRLKMIMIFLLLSSFVVYLTSCQEEILEPIGDINYDVPEVTAVTASKKTIAAGTTIDVAVAAKNGDSYSWSSDYGVFADPSSAATSWTSSGLESTTNAKLVCTITNGSGSSKASVTVTAVFLTPPMAHWTFDENKTDIVGGLSAVGDAVTINTTDALIGAGCAQFPGVEYGAEFDPAQGLVLTVPDGADIKTDAESDFTIMMWIKTDQAGYSIYSRTSDGEWNWEEGNKGWGFWLDYGYPSNAFASIEPWGAIWPEGIEFWDGEWHHYTAVHFGGDDSYQFYVDGENISGGGLSYGSATSDDGELVFTMGGNTWQGVLNGLMDEAKYFDQIVGESEIVLLSEN